MKKLNAFHLSLPCLSVQETLNFYVNKVGAKIGRSSSQWLDINFFGAQLTFVKAHSFQFPAKSYSFEGVVLPHFHFGVILEKIDWENQLVLMRKNKTLYVEPNEFLSEQIGNHNSFFIKDPNGYIVEFKCFKEPGELFKS